MGVGEGWGARMQGSGFPTWEREAGAGGASVGAGQPGGADEGTGRGSKMEH